MVSIGTKENKAPVGDKIKPEFSEKCTMNSYPVELATVKAGTPLTMTAKEVKVLTPVVQGSGQKYPYFQYVEVDFNGTIYGARVMLKENAGITGKEKEITLGWAGPTTYGMRIILGLNK